MEKIDVSNIMTSCAQAVKLQAFNWIKPPIELREQVEKEKKMYYERMETCKSCPIFDNGTCNSSRSIDIGGHLVYGCGCLIFCKAALEDNHCPISKW